MTVKICPRCKTEKPLDAFGFTKGRVRGYCKECNKAVSNENTRNRFRNDPAFVERERLRSEANRNNNRPYRIGQIFHSVRTSAKKRGITFNIGRDQLSTMLEGQSWCCAKTGVVFDLTAGKGKRPFGPTVDRIDNAIGYEPSNIQLVCNIYNYAKNEFNDDDVVRFAKALLSRVVA